jgi:hypothetical protein
MPKWKQQDEIVCMPNTVCCAMTTDQEEAMRIVSRHNADIDALTAERDELQAIIVAPPGLNEWSHDGDKITAIYSHRPAYAKSEADAKYLVRCHNHNLQMIHERECERDELQRRMDAVVMEHIRTAELKCYCEFDRDHVRTLECEYCEEVATLRAIAEGREG